MPLYIYIFIVESSTELLYIYINAVESSTGLLYIYIATVELSTVKMYAFATPSPRGEEAAQGLPAYKTFSEDSSRVIAANAFRYRYINHRMFGWSANPLPGF